MCALCALRIPLQGAKAYTNCKVVHSGICAILEKAPNCHIQGGWHKNSDCAIVQLSEMVCGTIVHNVFHRGLKGGWSRCGRRLNGDE